MNGVRIDLVLRNTSNRSNHLTWCSSRSRFRSTGPAGLGVNRTGTHWTVTAIRYEETRWPSLNRSRIAFSNSVRLILKSSGSGFENKNALSVKIVDVCCGYLS